MIRIVPSVLEIGTSFCSGLGQSFLEFILNLKIFAFVLPSGKLFFMELLFEFGLESGKLFFLGSLLIDQLFGSTHSYMNIKVSKFKLRNYIKVFNLE